MNLFFPSFNGKNQGIDLISDNELILFVIIEKSKDMTEIQKKYNPK